MKPSPGNGVPSLSSSGSSSSSSLRTPMGDRKRLIDELINSMKLLMSDDDSGGSTPPVVENGPHVDRFCLVIEFILLFGFKDKSKGLFSGQPRDYWNFIENLKTLHPPSKPSLERIGNSTKLKSIRARGRAWIRLALVESNLEANLRRLTNSNSLIQDFYEDWALLSQPTEREMLWGVLAPLSVVKFKLSFAIPFDTLPTSLEYYNQLQQLQALSAPAPPLPPSSSSSSTSSTPIPSPPSSGSLQTSTSEPTVDLLLINQPPSRPSLSLLSEMEGLSSNSLVVTNPPHGFSPLTPIPVFAPSLSPLTPSFTQGSSLPPPYPGVPPAPPRTGTPTQTQMQTPTQTQVEGNVHALRLQTEITNLQGRLRERDSAIDEKVTELLMTKKMLEQKAIEVEELKRSVGNPNKLEDQALNIHALRTALEEATKEAERYQQQLSAALRDSETRKRDYEIANREREALREQLVFATSQLEFAATNGSLGGEGEEQQSTIQQLREALEVHSSSSRTLEQELRQKDSLISALQTESALKSNSLEEVSLRVQQEEVLRSQHMNEMMKEIQLLRTDRERSHGEASRLEDEVRRWKEESENKQTEVESLRNRYAKLKGEVSETNQRLEKLDLEVRESKKNLQAKTEELEMYNRVRQETEDKNKSTETTEERATGGGGVDQNQLALILNEAAELKSKKSELEELLEGKKEEVQKLKGRLEDAERKINELTPPLKCTRSCQTDSELDTNLLLKKKEEEVKSITTSWKEEEGKVSFLEGKLALGSSEFERFKRQVETDHTILHQTNASLINELQQANSERDAFAEMMRVKAQENERTRDELQDLVREKDALFVDLQRSQTAIESSQEQLTRTTEQLREVSSQLSHSNSLLNDTRSLLHQKEKEVESLHSSLREKEERVSHLTFSVQQTSNSHNDLQLQLQNKNFEIEQLLNQVRSGSEQIQGMLAQFEELQQMISSKDDDIERLNVEYSRKFQAKEDEFQELRNASEETKLGSEVSRTRIAQLEEDVRRKEEAVAEAESQFERKVEELTLQLRELSLERMRSEEELKKKDKEVSGLREEMNQGQNNLEILRNEMNSRVLVTEERLQRMNQEGTRKQQEVVDLKKQLETKTKEIETMRKRLEMRDVQLGDLMKEVETSNEKEHLLKDELEEKEQELRRLKSSSQRSEGELYELKNKYFSKEGEVEELKSQLEERMEEERKINEKLEKNTQQLSMLENERRGIQQKSSALEEALSSMASLLEEAVKKSDEVEAALKHHLGNKAGPILAQLQRNQQLRRGEF